MKRRQFLNFASITVVPLSSAPARAFGDIADGPPPVAPGVILLDGSGITNVRELAGAIRRAGGEAWSGKVPDRLIYQTLVDTAVRYAQYAARRFSPVGGAAGSAPPDVLAVPVGGQSHPTLVFFRILGLGFAMPAARFFSIIVGSLWLLSLYLEQKTDS